MPRPASAPEPPRPEPAAPAEPGLRERTRRAVRTEVGQIAYRLFLEQGFEQTTTDEIAAAAGMSRSSFFRHFATKEDAVLGQWEHRGEQLLEALRSRPSAEPIWTSLQRTFEPLIEIYTADPTRTLAIARLIADTPSIESRRHEKQQGWQDLLLPEVARRIGTADEPADPRAEALVAAALGCLNAAGHAWLSSGGRVTLPAALDQAMAAVRG